MQDYKSATWASGAFLWLCSFSVRRVWHPVFRPKTTVRKREIGGVSTLTIKRIRASRVHPLVVLGGFWWSGDLLPTAPAKKGSWGGGC